MIKNVVGAPATGGNFFNRVQDQRRLLRRLDSDNVLLLAPRRVGKTSLLHRLADCGESEGFRTVYLSVSDQSREIDFLKSLYAAIEQTRHGASILGRAFDRLRRVLPAFVSGKLEVAKVFSVEFTRDNEARWRLIGQALVEALQAIEGRWVLMIDEFPLFVLGLLRAGRERARAFMNWFRDVRLDRASSASVRWLLCGSIGLDTVTRRERLGDTVNDFSVVRLGAFDRADADALLAALAESRGMRLNPTLRAHCLDLVGWLIPYHVQLLFASLADLCVDAPTPEHVDAAYAHLMRPSHKIYFDYWAQRLHDELGPVDAEHALAMLAVAARDAQGAAAAMLDAVLRDRGVDDRAHQRYLRDVLESDGYLVEAERRFRFRSPLLRDFWINRVL